MAAEKKGSKGRFLYLFDWNAKSRKKLFSSKSESSELKQGKGDIGSSTTLPFRLREDCFGDDGHSTRGSGNYFCGSSINEDDSYGTKAPSVVARLMGLDSLPASTAGETSSICSHEYESHVAGNSYYPRNPSGYQYDHHSLDFGYTGSKVGEYHWNPLDYRSSMVGGRPIERFQNEVLPPKSAKPISITHHKLLSPIKSPGFIPANDAAYIMEAAARIIDSGPRETSVMRSSSFGSSSTPIKIRDLKDKMEAAHRLANLPESSKRTKRSHSTNQLNGNSRDRLVDKSSSRILDLERSGACSSTEKGKVIPSALYGKDNVHRKDLSTSINSRKPMNREHNRVNLKQSSNSQSNARNSDHTRNSANRSSGLLRQNTEKQNGKSNTDNVISKYSDPSRQPRRSFANDVSSGSRKRVNKTLVNVNSESVSQKVASATRATEKRPPLNRMKNFSRSKDLPIKGRQIKKNGTATENDTALQTVADQKKGMDVISFTFNSPIKKTAYVSHSSSEMIGSSSLLESESRGTNDEFESKDLSSSLSRLNLIDNEDLSLLLEQKLMELTHKVELSDLLSDSGKQDTDLDSVSSCSDFMFRRNSTRANSIGHVERLLCEQDPYFAYREAMRREEIEGEGSSSSINKFNREGHHLGDIDSSVPRCFVSTGSCISPDRNTFSHGHSQAFIKQFEEETSCTSTDFQAFEDDRDISDTTSSYYDEWEGKHTSTSQSVSEFCPETLDNWELQYMRQIVHSAGLKETAPDLNREIIDSSVFDHVENLINTSSTNPGECTKLRRKLLFDCLNDCLCLKYERISLGSYTAWSRWKKLLKMEDWLVEELYREVLGLLDMGNLLVDELVEKDMGTQYSGWLTFEIETLEEGIDIEKDIVDSLINEMVVDFSLFYNLPNSYTYPIYLEM